MNSPDPDSLATGLIRVSLDGRILWLNGAAAVFAGRTPASLVNQTIGSIADSLERWCQRVAERGGSMAIAETTLRPNGERVDLWLQPIESDVLIEVHPVAERVHQREITERADRQQAMALLARGLAHELRNPLAGVRGAAQLIEHSKDAEASRRHAQMIQREVDRIVDLIDHFAGTGGPDQTAVNLHQVINDAAELVMAERAGRLRIQRQFDPSIPEQQGDPGRLHQLFLNLMRNSAQAGAGQLILTTRIEHDSPLVEKPARHAVRIDIDDDGDGVPEALRERLFLPLVTGRDQGSGFGLAVVQQIARAHGGVVEYLPLPGGSRFRVHLPLITARECAA